MPRKIAVQRAFSAAALLTVAFLVTSISAFGQKLDCPGTRPKAMDRRWR